MVFVLPSVQLYDEDHLKCRDKVRSFVRIENESECIFSWFAIGMLSRTVLFFVSANMNNRKPRTRRKYEHSMLNTPTHHQVKTAFLKPCLSSPSCIAANSIYSEIFMKWCSRIRSTLYSFCVFFWVIFFPLPLLSLSLFLFCCCRCCSCLCVLLWECILKYCLVGSGTSSFLLALLFYLTRI